MHLKNGKKLYNERGITFFHETDRYVNNLNIYNRSKNGYAFTFSTFILSIIDFSSQTLLIYSTISIN